MGVGVEALLFDEAVRVCVGRAPARAGKGLVDRFVAFHDAHPRVFRLFRRFAREWRDAGHTRCSAKMLFERIRWEAGVERGGAGLEPEAETPLLNNDFTACYARLLMRAHGDEFPDGFFEIRRSEADEAFDADGGAV